MELLTGESKATLDEKGRISLPSRLRNILGSSRLQLTKGLERCVWVFPAEQWEIFSEELMNSENLNMEQLNWVQHRFIAPSQPEEIDKAGRIALPQNIREYGNLDKDCIIAGTGKRIEIWSIDEYKAYYEANEPSTKSIVAALGHLSL
jgi:MraZ protein